MLEPIKRETLESFVDFKGIATLLLNTAPPGQSTCIRDRQDYSLLEEDLVEVLRLRLSEEIVREIIARRRNAQT